jgi:hypothetical protein
MNNEHILKSIVNFLEPKQATQICKAFLAAAVATVTNTNVNILKSEIFSEHVETLDLSFSKLRPNMCQFGKLNKLVLAACHWVDDAVLGECFGVNLRFVNLYWCVNITDEGVSALIRKNVGITTLILSGCNKLTDATMKTIAENLKTLTVLDVTRCPLVTGAGLAEICDSPEISESLRELNLYAKVQNIDASFYPKIASFRNLQFLDLCGHLKLTDADMADLLPKLPKLTRLNVSWCIGIGDATVLALANSKITSLSVFGIKRISAAAVEQFLETRGMSLVALDIRGIPNVWHLTEDNCKELRRRAVNLEEWKIHT